MIARSFALAACALALAGCPAEEQDEDPLPQIDYSQVSEKPEVRTISAIDLAAMLEAGEVVLIDLRPPAEFAAARIEGALNAPISHFDPATLPREEQRETVLYASTDPQAEAAARQIADRFGGTVRHLDGGIAAWLDAGRPTISD